MEKLKILVVNNLYPPQVVGGYERAIADYARLLQERGHQVLVITSNTEHLPTGYKKAVYLYGELGQSAEHSLFTQLMLQQLLYKIIKLWRKYCVLFNLMFA